MGEYLLSAYDQHLSLKLEFIKVKQIMNTHEELSLHWDVQKSSLKLFMRIQVYFSTCVLCRPAYSTAHNLVHFNADIVYVSFHFSIQIMLS